MQEQPQEQGQEQKQEQVLMNEQRRGLEAVIKRNLFYWESSRRIELAVILLIVMILALLVFLVYLRDTFPAPQYFATTPDGRPIPRIPLDMPIHKPETVVAWTEKAITNIYSLDFVNFRKTLQDAQLYFTLRGYLEFKQAYQASRNLEAVREKKEVVSAEIIGSSKIREGGVSEENNAFTWNLEVPVTVTYQNSANEVIKQTGKVLIRIVRTSFVAHPEGIAIAQLILQSD